MIFNSAEIPAEPWKNGRGLTQTLCARRDAGGLLWRISLAEITQEGEFSLFAGFNRAQVIVEGAGFTLQGTQAEMVLRPFEPVVYSGDLELTVGLTDGPCRAFNVIYDAERLKVTIDVLTPWQRHITAQTTVIFVVAGTARLARDQTLSAGQGICLKGPQAVNLAAGARVLGVRLSPL